MAGIKGGREFQGQCIERLSAVLAKHGQGGTDFRHLTDGLDRFVGTLVAHGHVHEIGVYKNAVSMWKDDELFECYMPEELVSESSLIESFAVRLDRYLSGGAWEGPNEKGGPDLFKEKMNAIFRRRGDS